MTGEILRTFIAIELEEPLRIAIARVQGKFKRQAPPGSVKWVAPEGIHLTLKFLGDTPASRVGEIEAALRAACAASAPFEFSVEGRGCFPNTRRPRGRMGGSARQGPNVGAAAGGDRATRRAAGLAQGGTRLLTTSNIGPRYQGRQPGRGGGGRSDGRKLGS